MSRPPKKPTAHKKQVRRAKTTATEGRPGARHATKNGSQARANVKSRPRSKRETGERIAKVIARAGLCSRREAERWIADGRVRINGKTLKTPAYDVLRRDRIEVDRAPLPVREPVRLWRYHKPKGLVTTHRDPQGRKTVFDALPAALPRVISIGRLDFNTEGLLLLTNDGALARHLELPSTGWLRRYRVRAHGRVTEDQLRALSDGTTIDGVRYGPIEAALDVKQGANQWLTLGLREGKNREVRRVLASLGLEVNRLIRISYGPFQLLDLKPGQVEAVRRKTLADQLGPKLTEEFDLSAEDMTATTRLPRKPRATKFAAPHQQTPDAKPGRRVQKTSAKKRPDGNAKPRSKPKQRRQSARKSKPGRRK